MAAGIVQNRADVGVTHEEQTRPSGLQGAMMRRAMPSQIHSVSRPVVVGGDVIKRLTDGITRLPSANWSEYA